MNTTNHSSFSFKRDAVRAVVSTHVAVAAPNRRPQTLCKWACLENGPIRLFRINGRLASLVADIQALLGGGVA
ncbi:DNA-binding protein [Paraburkholderia sp. PGU19]|uniref:DNA-binding protein n=1 Tax=Paraburkholderia sp. PGU19 TaxID=2735434 RepID=UPI0015D9EF3C|nr:DNA-binding protein [Paraburkholderia sp. PGU19]